MPCEDTTSSISVKINNDDCLVDYKYEKMTCGKPVGTGGAYQQFCSGKKIDLLAEVPFEEVIEACTPAGKEEEFLLYLEWKAVREALRQYFGLPPDSDSSSYRIAEIITDEEGSTIEMIIFPPEDMPPIVPCH